MRWLGDSTSGRRDAATLHHAKFVLCKVIKLPNYVGAVISTDRQATRSCLLFRAGWIIDAISRRVITLGVIKNPDDGSSRRRNYRYLSRWRRIPSYGQTRRDVYPSDFSRERRFSPGSQKRPSFVFIVVFARDHGAWMAAKWRAFQYPTGGNIARGFSLTARCFALKYREYFNRACSRATKYRHCHRVWYRARCIDPLANVERGWKPVRTTVLFARGCRQSSPRAKIARLIHARVKSPVSTLWKIFAASIPRICDLSQFSRSYDGTPGGEASWEWRSPRHI